MNCSRMLPVAGPTSPKRQRQPLSIRPRAIACPLMARLNAAAMAARQDFLRASWQADALIQDWSKAALGDVA